MSNAVATLSFLHYLNVWNGLRPTYTTVTYFWHFVRSLAFLNNVVLFLSPWGDLGKCKAFPHHFHESSCIVLFFAWSRPWQIHSSSLKDYVLCFTTQHSSTFSLDLLRKQSTFFTLVQGIWLLRYQFGKE